VLAREAERETEERTDSAKSERAREDFQERAVVTCYLSVAAINGGISESEEEVVEEQERSWRLSRGVGAGRSFSAWSALCRKRAGKRERDRSSGIATVAERLVREVVEYKWLVLLGTTCRPGSHEGRRHG
jgi:hypothetical protein